MERVEPLCNVSLAEDDEGPSVKDFMIEHSDIMVVKDHTVISVSLKISRVIAQ